MKETKQVKIIKKEIIMYQSDDGKFSSPSKAKVEQYEMQQRDNTILVETFALPNISQRFSVYKILSKDDMQLYKDCRRGNHFYFDGFDEEDIPEKISGYFVSHYEDWGDCIPHYNLETMDNFIKNLKQDIDEDRQILSMKEFTVKLLEKYNK